MSRGSLHLTIIPALCRNLGKELNKPLAKTKPMYNIATLEGAAKKQTSLMLSVHDS